MHFIIRNLSVQVECVQCLNYNLWRYGICPYTGGFMATARLDIRLDEEIKAKAEKASALLGLKSLTEYVVRLMDEDATHVIEEHESIVVKDSAFDEFMAACDKAKAPNQALLEAAKFTDESGIK
ncbi:hypothetical protein TUMSATVNIG1_59100 (plasmid) [Vibrio nigripulchritudo]|nr:DUF1778 domain-containing protein [Vibrio nigripulchritudo]BCL73925.1 hypothetical protein VNTUMSATTG_58620 [Vibrio nigripulchritudo]BDU35301.1 hypothetical protein TUMSATVNIG1_59100 [Vibrio nigripulchritudo]